MDSTFRASVVNSKDLPAEDNTAEGEDITITFDQNTGIIEKAVNLVPAEVGDSSIDPNLPQLFISRDEFESLTKVIKSLIMVINGSFIMCLRLRSCPNRRFFARWRILSKFALDCCWVTN